ncbi:TM2 domain-containing membrane protein YozV [Mycetocola sp. BIGb0189]|uniref:DUF4190 domain-containing protein n=1 Tax=Mycetocola sp. BIGb0189 TaxID=2940604 RepID=UPI00216A1235|nr:DUF4190 domain-containing protein [Mycetocola sp. BIGb0189]MCS4277583.1 TM2 domain-containing membrane protein YozV [Mycetocola sp. BIGb0189]
MSDNNNNFPGQPEQPQGQPAYPAQPEQPYGQPAYPAQPEQPYGQPAYPAQPEQAGYPTPQGYPAPEAYGTQQGYAQPAYPATPPRTNLLAILSLVFAFVFAPAGIVLGHISKKQLKTSGEGGAGLATAGLVLSYIFTALYIIGGILMIAFYAFLFANIPSDYSTY